MFLCFNTNFNLLNHFNINLHNICQTFGTKFYLTKLKF
jgi:hypothetical protein